MKQFLVGCLLGAALLVTAFFGLMYAEDIRKIAQEVGLIELTDEERFQEFYSAVLASEKYGKFDKAFKKEAPGDDLIKLLGIEGIKNSLLDPYSAKFKGIILTHNSKSKDIHVCGFVNGKNGYGAYAGFRPFSIEINLASSLTKTNTRRANIPSFDAADPNAYLDLIESWEGRRMQEQCGLGFTATMLNQSM